jgi:hypothetical protein
MLKIENTNIKKHTKAFLLIIFLLLSIAVLSLLVKRFLSNSFRSQKTVNITSAQIIQTTGVETSYKPMETPTPAEEQRAILIEFAPINEKTFFLKFSFKQDKFIIELKPPTKENYENFINWLKEGGLGDIPQENFVFENYQI